jgi:integrase/recombinase XerD
MVKVSRSFAGGPLGLYVAGFAQELVRQGYTVNGGEQHLRFVAHLSRWMLATGLSVGELDTLMLERFLAERRAAGYVRYRTMRAMEPLLRYLMPLGVLPAAEPLPLGQVDALLKRYCQFLVRERGLRQRTAEGYSYCVRPFVASRVDAAGGLDLAGVTAADVTRFVLAACPGRAVGTAKLVATGLRSLLDWLHMSGAVSVSLSGAVPPVAGWRLRGLPKGLEQDQLRRLLASCDRRSATGRRDYAILLTLARVGLRAGEVAGLRLDDIDWHAGEISVRGKGNSSERLPLPADVGAAIVGYLRRGRPSTAQGRSVFVRVKAPHGPATPQMVTTVVSAAGQRAGLGQIHAHRLRHTAATAMLRAGIPLSEVGQVLRHRSTHTTALYAKVDRAALVVLARPWPSTDIGVRS